MPNTTDRAQPHTTDEGGLRRIMDAVVAFENMPRNQLRRQRRWPIVTSGDDGFWAFLREPRLSYPIEYHSSDDEPACPPTIEQFYGVYSWVEAEPNPDPATVPRPYRMKIKEGGRFGTAGGGGGEDCGGARDVNLSNEAWEFANKLVWMRIGPAWGDLAECPSSEASSSTVVLEGESEAVFNLKQWLWFDGGSTGREECFQRFDISFAVNNNLP